MPSNLLDEFVAGIDPIDVATLFSGVRNAVPLAAMFRSGELNAGHDEELARRRGPTPPPAPRQRTFEDEQRDFEAQFPDPTVRRAVLAELIAQRTQPYHPATATRRKDFEAAPESARQSVQAAPRKKMATGGTVQHFNKGGGAKKTLDQMQAELFKKGTKAADKPDLSRRSFFGLGPQSSFPLANVDTKALEKMQQELKGAPAITEKSVTVDPGKGGVSETIKSVAATPMSRRSVLQTAAGQALRGVLPDMTGLGAVGDVAKAVESAVPQYGTSAIPGLMTALMRSGMTPDEAGAMVEKLIPKAPPGWPTMVGDRIKAPAENMPHIEQEMPLMSIFGEMVRPAFQNGPYSLRPEMRDLRRLSPEDYSALKETARDIKKYGFED